MLSSLARSHLIYLKLVPLAYRINDWFQHVSRNVREILDNQYPQSSNSGGFDSVTEEMITNATTRSLLRRAQLCIRMNGGHFEHLL
jgi:hypothetical protein